MLGVTVCGMKTEPTLAMGALGWGVGSKVLLHDAGACGAVLSDLAGQAFCPLGSDDIPGVGWGALSPELQLALGPEDTHCRPPMGSDKRGGSSLGTTWLT